MITLAHLLRRRAFSDNTCTTYSLNEDGEPFKQRPVPGIETLPDMGTGSSNLFEHHTPASDKGASIPFLLTSLPIDQPFELPTDSAPDHAILHAVAKGHREIVRLLLQYNGPVNVRDGQGRTPLHLAALHDREAVAVLLLQHGADINTRDWSGKTALHHAVDRGLAAIVELLLAHGAQMH